MGNSGHQWAVNEVFVICGKTTTIKIWFIDVRSNLNAGEQKEVVKDQIHKETS